MKKIVEMDEKLANKLISLGKNVRIVEGWIFKTNVDDIFYIDENYGEGYYLKRHDSLESAWLDSDFKKAAILAKKFVEIAKELKMIE